MIQRSISRIKDRLFFPSGASEGLDYDLLKRFNDYRHPSASSKLCHAPYKSLYFGHGGKAVTCCYNRYFVMGVYPQHSIHEIWFGEKANELRKYITGYNLEHGCHGCKEMLLAGNFDAVKARQYDDVARNKNGYPSVMEFELSNECNLGCIMCSGEFSSYIRKHVEKKESIHSAYDSNFVAQLDEFIPYLEETKFYGGEPFLVDIYLDIWERILSLNPNCRISVQTNASILSTRVKKILESGNFHINISIDSLQKERYESIRKNAKWEKVMENIHYLREYTKSKGTFFGLSFCMMRINCDEAANFIRFCNELDAKVYFHTVYQPAHLNLYTWDYRELEKLVASMEQEIIIAKTDIQKANLRHFEHWILQVKEWVGHTSSIDFERMAMEINKIAAQKISTDEQLILNNKLERIIHEKLLDDMEFTSAWINLSDEKWDAFIRLFIDKETDEIIHVIRHANQ